MRPDYTTYTSIQFALDDTFISYVLSKKEREGHFWETWIQENPQKNRQIEEAIKLIYAIQGGFVKYTTTHLPEEVENELLQKIQGYITTTSQPTTPKKNVVSFVFRVAAIFVLVSGLALLWVNYWKNDAFVEGVSRFDQPYVEYTNTSSTRDTILLPDDSRVILYPQSKIAYLKQFTDTLRTVILSGGAQFEVTKDAKYPFTVFSNQIATQVLGTVFEVMAYEADQEINVTVKEGKVALAKVLDNKLHTVHENKIVVQANQKSTYQVKEGTFNKRLIESPQRLPFTDHISLNYEEKALKKVFQDIEQVYGIAIVYDLDTIRHCQLTASLEGEEFRDILKIICTSVGLRYEIVETSVIITGRGCPNLS